MCVCVCCISLILLMRLRNEIFCVLSVHFLRICHVEMLFFVLFLVDTKLCTFKVLYCYLKKKKRNYDHKIEDFKAQEQGT